mmetsp:Transcript_3044/g.4599  ORF Transcript_3044/g.4599 Transcript_3044/m.4599 type:complete len:196 (+) Transcript_3044:462-1049(+)
MSTKKKPSFSHQDSVSGGRHLQNLADDAKLCTLLQNFSIHVEERASELSDALRNLERRIDGANSNVDSALMDFLRVSDSRVVHFEISDSADVHQLHQQKLEEVGSIPVSSPAEETEQILRAEEKEAIADGIAALDAFHDNENASDNYFEIDEDEEIETPYYYESAPADVFNQRPLPFIIGSKPFMESHDGGIGSE